jgi:hypothetical protein
MNNDSNLSRQEYETIRFELDKDEREEKSEANNVEEEEAQLESDDKSPAIVGEVVRNSTAVASSPSPAAGSPTSDRDRLGETLSTYLLNMFSNPSKSKEFKTYLDYIVKLGEPGLILNDEKAIEALISLNILLTDERDNIQLTIETEFYNLIRDMLGYLYKNFDRDLKKGKLNNTSENVAKFFILIELTESLVCYSKSFCTYFYLNSGVEFLVLHFRNKKLSRFFTKTSKSSVLNMNNGSSSSSSSIRVDAAVEKSKSVYCESLSLIMNIFLILKVHFKSFLDLKIVEVMLEFANHLSSDKMDLIFKSFLFVNDLCSDEQVTGFNQIEQIKDLLCSTIGCFAEACVKSAKYKTYM